jgi:hypothetical protein
MTLTFTNTKNKTTHQNKKKKKKKKKKTPEKERVGKELNDSKGKQDNLTSQCNTTNA